MFIALGGTSAYAANTIGSADVIDESLLSQDIKNAEVKNADIGSDQVTTGKIRSGNVGTSDLAAGAVTPLKLGTTPTANVYSAFTETVAAATNTALHADSEIFDTANLHDTSSNTENLVAPVSGTYAISASVDWDPNGVGYRRVSLAGPFGALASVSGPPLPSPAFTSQNASGIERLSAGQSVRVEVVQGSGGNLAARIHRFQMTFVGR
jgi:hypothetical protein